LEGLDSSEQDKDIADDTPGRRREAVPDPRLSNQVPAAELQEVQAVVPLRRH